MGSSFSENEFRKSEKTLSLSPCKDALENDDCCFSDSDDDDDDYSFFQNEREDEDSDSGSVSTANRNILCLMCNKIIENVIFNTMKNLKNFGLL